MRGLTIAGVIALMVVLTTPGLAQRGRKRSRPAPPAPMAMPGTESAPPLVVTAARRVSVDDLQSWMDEGLKIRFVDTRSSFTGAKISGADHVPELEVGAWSRNLPKDTVIVAYCTCSDEHTSINTVLKLQQAGFIYAYALKGGLSAWQAASLPTQVVP